MKDQAVVIYASTVDRISEALESGALEDCNIVGVCTDEFVPGDISIKNIPIVQITDVHSPLVLLDEDIPNACKKMLEEKGVLLWKLEQLLEATNTDDQATETANIGVQPCEGTFDEVKLDATVVALNEPNEDAAETVCEGAIYFSDEQADTLRVAVTTWLEKIYQAINNTKNKDISIYNINKELQTFKDGYYRKITSPIISEIITLREDYKKSIEDCSKFGLSYEKQRNYLDCTIDQINEILANYDVEIVDGQHLYNGKCIYPSVRAEGTKQACLEDKYIEIERESHVFDNDASAIRDCTSLEQFMAKATSNIETLLQNNEALINSIEIQNADLKKQQAVTDGLLVVPLLRKIIRMKMAFLSKREMLENFKEEAETIYKEAYEYGITYAESILMSLGINIRSAADDVYDPKYHRILKMQRILPEEAGKDKHIAAVITDCYVSDERVVAPAKVVVYKL